MERTFIQDLRAKIGQQVILKGWLQTLRDQKSMQFLILRDRTGLVQVTHWKRVTPNWRRSFLPLGQNPR